MTDTEATTARSYVIFRLGPEQYGLPIASVNSIIRFEEATPVPRAPEAVLGVINIRGRVVPVVDLSKRFGKGDFAVEPTSRIVVAEGVAGPVGIAVDSASEVAEFPVADIRPVPESILSPETSRAFEGVVERDSKLVILLDLDQAVPHSQYASAYDDEFGEGDSDG